MASSVSRCRIPTSLATRPQPFRQPSRRMARSLARSSLEPCPAGFRAAIWRGGSTGQRTSLHVHGRAHLGRLSPLVSRPLDRIEVAATALRADPPDVAHLHEAPECPVCVSAKHPAYLLPGDARAQMDQLIDFMCDGSHRWSLRFAAALGVGGTGPLEREKDDRTRRGPPPPPSTQ